VAEARRLKKLTSRAITLQKAVTSSTMTKQCESATLTRDIRTITVMSSKRANQERPKARKALMNQVSVNQNALSRGDRHARRRRGWTQAAVTQQPGTGS